MQGWLERVQGVFKEEVGAKLLAISAASIDRVLKSHKYLGGGRCGTKPVSLLRIGIPGRTTVWDLNIPGFLKVYTVEIYILIAKLVNLSKEWKESLLLFF
jgi:hypothetical protein